MENLMLMMVLLVCVYYECKSARTKKIMNEWNEMYEQNQIELGMISKVDRI